MEKIVVHTDRAPAAIGPYSQAIDLGTMVFTSGQITSEVTPETRTSSRVSTLPENRS